MQVTVEISYYPLQDKFLPEIDRFLQRLQQEDGWHVQVGAMSTVVSGAYPKVFATLQTLMEEALLSQKAVFNLKISSACPVCFAESEAGKNC